MLKKEDFLGYNFINSNNIREVAVEIMNHPLSNSNGDLPIVLTPNVDYIVKLNRSENKDLNIRLSKSAFILPDGQPIIWAAKYYKKDIRHRLTGSDLFTEMYNIAKTRKTNTLLITSGEVTSNFYKKDFPASVVYTLPYINHGDTDAFNKAITDCVSLIAEHKIETVFLGISFPKQDIIALGIYDQLKALKYINIPLLCLLGASLEFGAGVKKRAPVIYQKIGMEWFYRFATEPKRLFKRYFIESFEFLSVLKSFK